MQAARSSETFVSNNHTTRCNDPQNNEIRHQRRENLTPQYTFHWIKLYYTMRINVASPYLT